MIATRTLSDGFGMVMDGIDLSRLLTDDDFKAVEQAFFDDQILAIKGQVLEPAAILGFARRFGRPEPHVIGRA